MKVETTFDIYKSYRKDAENDMVRLYIKIEPVYPKKNDEDRQPYKISIKFKDSNGNMIPLIVIITKPSIVEIDMESCLIKTMNHLRSVKFKIGTATIDDRLRPIIDLYGSYAMIIRVNSYSAYTEEEYKECKELWKRV